jgi:hypothetical protein
LLFGQLDHCRLLQGLFLLARMRTLLPVSIPGLPVLYAVGTFNILGGVNGGLAATA